MQPWRQGTTRGKASGVRQRRGRWASAAPSSLCFRACSLGDDRWRWEGRSCGSRLRSQRTLAGRSASQVTKALEQFRPCRVEFSGDDLGPAVERHTGFRGLDLDLVHAGGLELERSRVAPFIDARDARVEPPLLLITAIGIEVLEISAYHGRAFLGAFLRCDLVQGVHRLVALPLPLLLGLLDRHYFL